MVTCSTPFFKCTFFLYILFIVIRMFCYFYYTINKGYGKRKKISGSPVTATYVA